MKYLYGPVPSRRLGVSLGIDLIPYKACSFNCVYCECGATTKLTDQREEFVPHKEVIKELDEYLKEKPKLDYITFSGSGEPSLYQGLKEIVDFVKDSHPEYKLALLTNSSLLNNKSLRKEISKIDLVVPSIDSVIKKNYEKINRPHKNIKLDNIIKGLIKLREEFSGKLWLEIFIIQNLNDSKEEINKFKEIIEKIKPDRIQLNTLDRPGTESWVKKETEEKLKEILDFFGEKAEIIGPFIPKDTQNFLSNSVKTRIKEIIKRRPCTINDISQILNLHVNQVNKYLRELSNENKIESKTESRGVFYYISEGE